MDRPKIALIAAVANNGVIGRDNELPWRLSDDLKRFKALTLGHPVIMGRKTWDSLGKPLPGRDNIIITRQLDFLAQGAKVVHSLDDAIEHCRSREIVFVIGGAQLYEQVLPRADLIYLTEVHASVEGDAYLSFDKSAFKEVMREPHSADDRHDHPFDFVEYRRRSSH